MTDAVKVTPPRWDSYFMKRGIEFNTFWQQYLNNQKRDILYIMGKGFDPRMCKGIECLLASGGRGTRDCLLIAFDEGNDSPSVTYSEQAKFNEEKLKHMVTQRGNVSVEQIRMWSKEGQGRRRTSSLNAASVLNADMLFPYSDIVIDVSAMPRGIYFSMIGKAIYLIDQARQMHPTASTNLHIIVCESAGLDGKIHGVGLDDAAEYIHGFGGAMIEEGTEEIPRIWIPILGEGHVEQLEKIHEHVNPEETCPVLPLPSVNPRRIDELLMEYRESLLRWRVERSNIIYAPERNPFEAYRQISSAAHRYFKALEPMGGCKTAISALSSKTLSIGALLAAYELKDIGLDVGLAHIEAQGYEMPPEHEYTSGDGELCTLWLTGDCYE